MATKKITELVEITAAANDDVLPIVDISTDITNKIKVENLPISNDVQTALNGKEDLTNKSTSVTTDQASNTKYPSVKAVYDWAVGLFATLTQLATKQDTLVSGTNIKTVNSTSLLGSGDIPIPIVNPSGVSGSIQFSDGSAFSSDATNLFWDNTNKRLGVGTNAPSARIHSSQLFGASSLSQLDRFGLFVGYSSATFGIAVGGSSVAGAGAIQGTNATGNATGKLSLNPLGGNVSVGQVASGGGLAMLEVRGSGATSATDSLLVQNSAGTPALKIEDNLTIRTANTLIVGGANDTVGRLGFFNENVRIGRTGASGLEFLTGSVGLAMTINSSQSVGIGEASPTARLHVKGSGTTSATTALLVQNSAGTAVLTVKDGGADKVVVMPSALIGSLEIVGTTIGAGGGASISFPSNRISLGSGSVETSSRLQVDSTTQGFLPPRMTTTQKNAISSPASGLQVYDTTLNQMSYYNGSSWINF